MNFKGANISLLLGFRLIPMKIIAISHLALAFALVFLPKIAYANSTTSFSFIPYHFSVFQSRTLSVKAARNYERQ
jgi:hypothetical protein